MSTDRNLTVARLVEDHINGIEVEGDAFGDLLDSLGVAPEVEQRAVVTSEKAGDPETRAYIVSVHSVPGTDDTTRVYSCTCGAFKFHELLSNVEDIRSDPRSRFRVRWTVQARRCSRRRGPHRRGP
jgi:hypothetical protein